MLMNIQEFLDENRDALDPDFVAEMEQKLAETRARHQDLQKQAQHKQKELEVAVASAIKQNTEKVDLIVMLHLLVAAETNFDILFSSIFAFIHSCICLLHL